MNTQNELDTSAKNGSVADDQPRRRNRLIKKYYLSLTPGSYLVSNTITWDDESIFSETVATSKTKREQQWNRIMAAHAFGRLCIVYPSKKRHDKLKAEFFAETDRQSALKTEHKLACDCY